MMPLTSAERIARIEALKRLALIRKAELGASPSAEALAAYSEILDEVERTQRIEAGFQSIMTFAQNYFTGNPPHDLLKTDTPSPPFHYDLADYLREATLDPNERKTAICAPRSHAKSTIITNIFPLWIAAYMEDLFEIRYVLLLGDKQENAKRFLDVIKMTIEDNELFRADFGDLKGSTWNSLEIVTKNGVKISAGGAGEGLRGVRFGSFRPGVVILDDVESEESCETSARISKMLDWLDRTVLPLSDPKHGKFFMVGTIINYGSVLNTILTQRPEWTAFRYQAIEQFPAEMSMWNKFEDIYHSRIEGDTPIEAAKIARQKALQFYADNKEIMDAGAKVLWPERMSLLQLMEIRTTRRLSFLTEYMNMPVDEATRVFKMIHYFDLNQLNLSECDIYGGCDPSIGGSKRADPSALIMIARNRKTGVMYVIDADAKVRSPDETIRTILQKARIYKPRLFSIETTAFQAMMATELQRKSAEQQVYLPIREFKSTTKKEVRITSLEPLVSNGLLRFLPTHRDLIEQLQYFPKGSGHDDLIDCVAQVVDLVRNTGAQLVYGHL